MRRNSKKSKFFIKLLNACGYKDAYSVPEICQYFGKPYQEILDWAATDDHCMALLERCHTMCETNIELAALMSRLPNARLLPFSIDSQKA